ncbi:MAG: ComEC family competence protein [Armatimonadota bacterium]|nr:ComEC family competence protein [Armatimonadota bacterium]
MHPNASGDNPVSILRNHPLATLCLCYVAGAMEVVAAPSGSQPVLASAGAFALLALAGGGGWRSGWRTPFGERIGLLLPILAFAAGILLSTMRLIIPATDVSHYASAHFVTLRGTLVSEPRSLPFGTIAEMECQEVKRGTCWTAVTGKTQLWASKNFGAQLGGASMRRWPRLGEPVEVRGVLHPISGGSPAADNLLRRRIFCTLRVGKGGRITPLPQDGFSVKGTLRNGCAGAAEWVQEGLSGWLQPRERDALAGMLFHRQENMTAGTLDDLQKTGTIHIIATAGLHVGIFMGCCLFVLSALLPRRTTLLLTMALLAGYCVTCGGWPAVFRATMVAELYLLARLLGRLPDPLTCLSLAAAWLVFLEPNTLLDAGFQLTFATVGVILLIMGSLHQTQYQRDQPLRSRMIEPVKGIAKLSLAAQLGSWPLVAYTFNIISFVGIFANLLIVPLLMLIIPLAMLTAILSHLMPWIAVVPGTTLQSLIHLLLWIAHQLAAWPPSWKYVDNVPAYAVVTYYAVVVVGLGWVRMKWPADPEKSRG